MRTPRLYLDADLSCGQTIQLDHGTSKHLIKVLRLPIGNKLILFNGDGFNYFCESLDNHQEATTVKINSKQTVNNESPLSITLIQGLSRQDRMSTSIQKSVELGVNKIIPVIMQYSNLKLAPEKQIKKIESWQKVIHSACEQSGRCQIPKLENITTLNQLDTLLNKKAHKYILQPMAEQTLLLEFESNYKIKDTHIIEILIGPEGGVSETELNFLQQKNFCAIRFGPRILRTETAGPAVISCLQMLWGDFKS